MNDPMPVNADVAVPLSEIELRASRSSGPGGQHANVTASRVEAVFEIAKSATLTDEQKRRLATRHGERVTAIAQDARSQARNRELAIERVADALREALHIERRRRPTKPSRAAVERRLEQKRRRSQTKRLRQPPRD